jgi:4-carboxymuconolactone decarboxylase
MRKHQVKNPRRARLISNGLIRSNPAGYEIDHEFTQTFADGAITIEQYVNKETDDWKYQFWVRRKDTFTLLDERADYPAGFRFTNDLKWIVRMQKTGSGEAGHLYRDPVTDHHPDFGLGQAARQHGADTVAVAELPSAGQPAPPNIGGGGYTAFRSRTSISSRKPGGASASLMTKDEARRIAAGIVRLPELLRAGSRNPEELSASQKEVYGLVDSKFVPWSETAGFQSKTKDGRLIGPFNSVLFSPEMSSAFLAWQVAEEKHTSLDPRVRQVVILTVGAVWKADYELYAHSAVARKAGLHDNTIAELAAGSPARDLTEAEQVAQRFTTELTASRRVDDVLFNAAKEHFGLKGLVDLLSLIGAYQTVCGLLNGFAVPAPED